MPEGGLAILLEQNVIRTDRIDLVMRMMQVGAASRYDPHMHGERCIVNDRVPTKLS